MESFPDDDIDLRRMHRTPMNVPLFQRESRQAQSIEALYQLRKRHPQIDESPKYHVPTHARETVEMKMRSHRQPSLSFINDGAGHLTQGARERQSARSEH